MGPTATLLVRRVDYDAVGGFSGDLVLGDVEFSHALRSLRRAVIFEPRAVVEHHHVQSLGSFILERWSRGVMYGTLRAAHRDNDRLELLAEPCGVGLEVRDDAGVEQLASGFRWAEGPQWFGDGRYLLFSDIPNNRILRWDDCSAATSVFRAPSNHANGLARDRCGRLLACEHLSRRITRTEYDATMTRLRSAGAVVVHEGVVREANVRFAYFETDVVPGGFVYEIADMLGMPVNTVKTHLYRARARLAGELDADKENAA